MDYHQNARTTVAIRMEIARAVLERGLTLKLAAASFNVSAKTAAKWTRRFQQGGAAGLGDRSSRPRLCHRQTSPERVESVLGLRRLRWNGWRIARELKLSRATVSRILRRAGLNRLRSLDPPPPVVRYEHRHPGSMIHFDIKRLARGFFSRFGFTVRRVLTDNGSCYRHHLFGRTLRQASVKHPFTRIYRPQTKGKAERFIQTAPREWAYARTYQNSLTPRRTRPMAAGLQLPPPTC